MAILSYGPYYESKIQSREKTKKALTGQGYTPEELAGATYGELMARYKDAEVRRQEEETLALKQQQLGLYGRELRGQEKAAKATERGQAISGIATGINVLDKLEALSWGKKAITGLVSPGIPAWRVSDYGEEIADYVIPTTTGEGWLSGAYRTVSDFITGGTVICTELYKQGLLDEKTYKADSAYGSLLDDDILIGYKVWGQVVARLMSKSKVFTRIVSIFAIPWAKEMAFQIGVLDEGSWLGRIMNKIGIPICRFIGRLIMGGVLCPRAG